MKKGILLAIFFFSLIYHSNGQLKIFVSVNGNDKSIGNLEHPFASIEQALIVARKSNSKEIHIYFRKGTYYPANTIEVNSTDFKGKNFTIEGYRNEKVIFSGAEKFQVVWKKYNEHIYAASLSVPFETDAMFIDGKPAILARYPNYDSNARVFNGTAADAISEDRVKNWADPTGGFFHALHIGEWGSFHYRITGKDSSGKLSMIGGWQNNRQSPPHKEFRFVENIFEELDAPGEWYYNKKAHTLFYYPRNREELNSGIIELSRLKSILLLKGTEAEPLKNFRVSKINFTGTKRVLFEKYEPMLRSDWMIYREASITMDGTKDCKISDCDFFQLGANAIMVTGFNKNISITGNHIRQIGSSAICFVGEISAVRSPAFNYDQSLPYENIDQTAGPKNNLYPSDCLVYDNLIHDIGRIEKQATGVEISMSQNITVKNNAIYNTPRAGINIGDGCWGGHDIEYNDVFYTVQETGDHGSFNSWGRDRYWNPDRKYMDSMAALHHESILLDAVKTTQIHHNRFRCDHGWDIDLDDGSSNYHIYDNICLNGGLKLREGFYRVVENNIIINNSFHPHVWFKNSGDVFRKNIVTRDYYPIEIAQWGKEVDYNLFPDSLSLAKAPQNHTDMHSLFGNPIFEDAAKGNYVVAPTSPALKLGFENFDETHFGVVSPKLKAIAEKIPIPELVMPPTENNKNDAPIEWLDASIRNVSGLGDRSAFGLDNEQGVIVVSVQNPSKINSGLQPKDVILEAEGKPVKNIFDLISEFQSVNWKGKMEVRVKRNQQVQSIMLNLKAR